MKFIKIAVAAVLALGAGSAWAFHSGGVAECEGCHSMHNSLEGQAMSVSGGGLGPYLLIGQDQSSTCLDCHSGTRDRPSSYHINSTWDTTNVLTNINFTPGGDFSWVTKTYTFTPRSGTIETSLGERHGHSVVARDFTGFNVDGANATAPGGGTTGYPAASLACSSCHDPHGKYRRDSSAAGATYSTTGLPIRASGSYNNTVTNEPNSWSSVGAYRLLAGNGYQPKSLSGSFAFTAPPPAAKVVSNYNVTEAVNQNRVAYGTGMSEWCGNCHGSFHRDSYTSGTAGLTHPAGSTAALGFVAGLYNSYKKSGDLTGVQGSSFSSLVPFEVGATASYTDLAAQASWVPTSGGPDATANVMCLSCHRAHASGFDSMTRFSLGNEFTTVADAAGVPIYGTIAANPAVAMGRSNDEQQAAYYGRPATYFAPYQRAYCNKCHAKD
jgi:hypothetical protein